MMKSLLLSKAHRSCDWPLPVPPAFPLPCFSHTYAPCALHNLSSPDLQACLTACLSHSLVPLLKLMSAPTVLLFPLFIWPIPYLSFNLRLFSELSAKVAAAKYPAGVYTSA